MTLSWEAAAVIVAMATFICSLIYQNWRDRQNKVIDIRMQYLIDTYRHLSVSGNRPPEEAHKYWDNLETVAADIQLFGSNTQIDEVIKFAKKIADEKYAGIDELVNELRDSLRSELRLPPINSNVVWLRFRKHGRK